MAAVTATVTATVTAAIAAAITAARAGRKTDVLVSQVDASGTIHPGDNHRDNIALFHYIADGAHAFMRHPRDMQQTFTAWEQLDEGPEVDQPLDNAAVLVSFLYFAEDVFDHMLGLFIGHARCRRDADHAVVLDADFGAGLFDDRADDLAARTNQLANAIGIDPNLGDTRRHWRKRFTGLVDRRVHLFQNIQAAFFRFGQSLAQEIDGNAGQFQIELERGDPFPGARNLEVHVAKVVLDAGNVIENGVFAARLVGEHAHSNAADRRSDWNAGSHQRQRSRTDRGHRR